jgi:DNA polymerase III alpha subunit (gram-positive type)
MGNRNQQNEKGKKKKVRFQESPGKNVLSYLLAYSIFFLLLLLLPIIAQENPVASTAQDQEQAVKTQPHFYNVDREITVEGQVEDLKFEGRYEGKGHFLILMVKEKSRGEVMEVETAPAWFFKTDIHKGEKIRVVGSLTEDEKQGKKLVIAREIRINNQTITLRDRRGFPAWSRGLGRKRGSVD